MKDGYVVHLDSYYYGGDDRLNTLSDYWSPGGMYFEYFKNEMGIEPQIVDTFMEIKAKGRHKKLTDDGVVGVILNFI